MPLSSLYGAISNYRNALYEKGFFRSVSLGAPTISVGNITVGGTGKTPLVAYIAEYLAEKGEKVAILTRGYGRKNPRQRLLVSNGEKILANASQSGDEPFELALKLLGKAIVVADADRASAGIWAREKFGITVFILDDAFQHQKVKRDLNIVTIDATNPFGNGKCLPGGILREPVSNLRRADLIMITRANLRDSVSDLVSRVRKFANDRPVIISENHVSNFVELEKFCRNSNRAQQKHEKNHDLRKDFGRVFAVCAIGNPDNFFEMLIQNDIKIAAKKAYPDHHLYTQYDIAKIERLAQENGADILVITAKDAVKLENLKIQFPCFVVEQSLTFDNEKKLRELISAVFSK